MKVGIVTCRLPHAHDCKLADEVFRLRALYGKTYPEIGAELGIKADRARRLMVLATAFWRGWADGRKEIEPSC